MWFRKSKNKTKDSGDEARFPGEARALDGHASAYAVETLASEAVVVQSSPDLTEIAGALRNIAPHGREPITGVPTLIREVERLGPLAGLVSGYASTGLRTSALVGGLSGIEGGLSAAAGKRLTCVFNVACRALTRQSGSLHGSHDDYYRAAGAGLFQLFAANAQEVADFTLIAHRVAELSLTPGICAQDLYRTSHAVQNVLLPERDLVLTYLGLPGEFIASPTPAQEILFGEKRRRIPLLVDPDHPAGIGGVQDEDSYFRALAAQRPFFFGHVGTLIDEAMQEYGDLTGRYYSRASGYRAEDAEIVVAAQGAVTEELEAVVDYLRSEENVKAGVINVSAFRPFPGAQLTQMLKGKSAVTVLERTDQPLAEDLPLSIEIRCAVDKAAENGKSSGGSDSAYPSYAAYTNPADRPRMLSGVYGVGGRFPSFAELLAVFKNMLPESTQKKSFYLGTDFDREIPRLPHLQTMFQKMDRGYPGLAGLSLSAAADSPSPEHPGRVIQLYSLASQGGLFAGNLFAQTLAESAGRSVRTFPQGGLEQNLQTTCFTFIHADAEKDLRGKPDAADILLLSSHNLVEQLPNLSAANKNAALVVATNKSPDDLWSKLSPRAADWIRERGIRLHAVDARKIAGEAASKPSHIDQLAVWALLGSYLKADSSLDGGAVDGIKSSLRAALEQIFGSGHYLVDDVIKALSGGYENLLEINLDSLSGERAAAAETEAPWTVEESVSSDGTVFDPARFWHSVGYFYNNGLPGQTLSDPHLATGIIPARSSVFHDMTPYRLGIPSWLPESCTGCGLCWTHCPDSALPSTIQSLASIINTAIAICQEEGAGMVQMQRVGTNLAKLAQRLITQDGLNQYLTAGTLLRETFSQLVEKMGLEGDDLNALTEEFDLMVAHVERFQLAKTETFFEIPNQEEKGSGTLLSITPNPLSCKGCGLCVEVCSDKALEWTEQTGDLLDTYRDNWRFQMKLPEAEDLLQKHVSAADKHTAVNRLLSKTAYNSMVGGDGAAPGNSAKTAVHLLTAVVEATMKPRFKAHAGKLSELIEKLENKIQGKVASTLEINDFESFGRSLSRLDKRDVTAEDLSSLAGGAEHKADQDQLKRWSDLLGRLKEQRDSYLKGSTGDGRARMAAAVDHGAGSFWSGTYPLNPHPHPWICQLPGDAPALAEGVFEGITRKVAGELSDCRRAELELGDSYVPEEHEDLLEKFGWNDFNAEEKSVVPPVVVLAQAGTTGWESISTLLSRGYPIVVAVINTVGISLENTGRDINDLGFYALAHHEAFVLQTTVGHPGHYIQGVAESLEQQRPVLLHVYAPDPQGCGISPEKVPEQARLAYESRAFPLFKFDPENTLLTIEENPDPGADWAARELRTSDRSGLQESLTTPLTVADWAVSEGRFRKHFRVIPSGQMSDRMKPLAEYLRLDADGREGVEAYIHVAGQKHGRLAGIVSPEMIAATEQRLNFWNHLRAWAGAHAGGEAAPSAGAAVTEVKAAPASPAQGPQPVSASDQDAYKTLTEKLLWLCGFNQDPEYFTQSLREFITRSNKSENN